MPFLVLTAVPESGGTELRTSQVLRTYKRYGNALMKFEYETETHLPQSKSYKAVRSFSFQPDAWLV